MNPFKREQHLEDSHSGHLQDSDVPAEMDSDESRALHRYFHAHLPTDHDHPEGDY